MKANNLLSLHGQTLRHPSKFIIFCAFLQKISKLYRFRNNMKVSKKCPTFQFCEKNPFKSVVKCRFSVQSLGL